jgi:nitroreductase
MSEPVGSLGREVHSLIRSRRVCRSFESNPIARADLEAIVDAACWAPSSGNWRLHRFIVVQDEVAIDAIRAFAPGMMSSPPAMVVICTDLRRLADEAVQASDMNRWIDLGAAAQNMMILAESLGLASCPTTAFSVEAVRILLELPDHFTPDYILMIGRRRSIPRMRTPNRKRVVVDELTSWFQRANAVEATRKGQAQHPLPQR